MEIVAVDVAESAADSRSIWGSTTGRRPWPADHSAGTSSARSPARPWLPKQVPYMAVPARASMTEKPPAQSRRGIGAARPGQGRYPANSLNPASISGQEPLMLFYSKLTETPIQYRQAAVLPFPATEPSFQRLPSM